jgi:triacylglycerol lipase
LRRCSLDFTLQIGLIDVTLQPVIIASFGEISVFIAYVFVTLIIVALILSLLERVIPLPLARGGLALERMLSRMHLRQATVDGFAMPYLEGGSGPLLLLIHGFGADKDAFTRMARHLVPHYHVISPDLPGFGEAGRKSGADYTIAAQVARLHALLTQLNLLPPGGKIHIGGNSMGGFISAQFAATYPDQVASVWLLDAAGTEEAQRSEVIQRYVQTGKVELLVQEEADFDKLMAVASHKKLFVPRSVRFMLTQRAMADFALHSEILQQFGQSPLLASQYQQLTTPALIVWGEQDLILHPDGAAALAKLFVSAKVIMMPGIGHMPMLEDSRQTALDYLAFRQKLGG